MGEKVAIGLGWLKAPVRPQPSLQAGASSSSAPCCKPRGQRSAGLCRGFGAEHPHHGQPVRIPVSLLICMIFYFSFLFFLFYFLPMTSHRFGHLEPVLRATVIAHNFSPQPLWQVIELSSLPRSSASFNSVINLCSMEGEGQERGKEPDSHKQGADKC